MERIQVKNKSHSHFVREQKYGANAVRVYKLSPEDMALQIWNDKGRYTLLALLPQEARAIADALYKVADEFIEPLEEGELEKIIRGDQ